jgi:hypothetical protein
MNFSTGAVSREGGAGCNHFIIPITLQSGLAGNIRFTLDEFQGDPPDSIIEAKDRILDRLRSAAKEANATTFAQISTAISNKTGFKV